MSDNQVRNSREDPLIDEIRAIRRAISEQFGNDVDRLCDHLQELERTHPERLAKDVQAISTAPDRKRSR